MNSWRYYWNTFGFGLVDALFLVLVNNVHQKDGKKSVHGNCVHKKRSLCHHDCVIRQSFEESCGLGAVGPKVFFWKLLAS